MTVADAVYHRFNSRVASGLAAFATLIGVIVFLGTQVFALGLIIAFIFDISITAGIIIGMLVVVLYSTAGGILAGTYASVFQGMIMAVGSIVVFVYTVMVGEGLGNITYTIATTAFDDMGNVMPEFVSPWGLAGPVLAMSWFFGLSIGILGQPHVVTRFYMIKNVSSLKWGPVVSTIPAVRGGLLTFGVGLLMRYLVMEGQIPPLANPDDAILVFLTEFTPPIVAGLVFAAVASAIMSTCDSFINIASAAVVRDLPFTFGKTLSNEKQLFYGRIAVVVISIITVFVIINMGDQGIALLGAVGWGTFAASLAPVLGLGLNWKRATKAGAISSIVTGLFISVFYEITSTLGIYQLPGQIYVGGFAMLVSLIVFIGVSYLTKPEKLSKKMHQVMDA
jgi:sodium/proline symporter/sodium/pantothenate symporter